MIGGGFMGAAVEGMPVPTAEDDGGRGGLDLPPGFRFHPTDEEIITEYLLEKARNKGFNPRAVGEVDLNKNEPWELPSKAKMGEKEWYFFCRKDRKYPTGMRTNRATESGYWKATGKDKEIYGGGNDGCLVGMKKTLVFYKGRAPKGQKTSWVMHEYRLEGRPSSHHDVSQDLWVACRVFHKSTGAKKPPPAAFPDAAGHAEKDDAGGAEAPFRDDFLAALPPPPPLMDDGGNGGDFKPAVPPAPTPGSTFYFPSVASLQDFGGGAYSDRNDYNLESRRQEPVLHRQALSSSPSCSLLQMPGDDRPPSAAGQAAMYLQDTFWDY